MIVEALTFFVACFSSLITIINPFSTASVFLTVSRGTSKKKKQQVAKKACIIAAILLIVFALMGTFILSFFSITVDAFRIAGGMLIAIMGFRMLNAQRKKLHTEEEKKEALEKDDISVIPLAIPMISGPGALTTALVLMGSAQTPVDGVALLVAIGVACFVTYFVLKEAQVIDRYLGATGHSVVDKIMGLIVLVVGIQFILNGIQGVLFSWGLFF